MIDDLQKRANKEDNIYKKHMVWYDWHNWLINYILELIKKLLATLKTKL